MTTPRDSPRQAAGAVAAGRIRLGFLVGPEPELEPILAGVLRYLEADWFAVDVLAAREPPAEWARWAGQGHWTRVPWRVGWQGVARVRAHAVPWAAGQDVCAVWGFSALAAAPRHPVLVYARTAPPTRGEAVLARRAAAMVDVGSRDAERGTADARATRVTLGAGPASALPSPGPGGSRILLWAGAGAAPALVAASRTVAADLALPLELVDDARPAAWAGARVAILPLAEGSAAASLLDVAMWSGGAVLATQIPGIVGRVRCPVEALVVDGTDPGAWREAVGVLLEDDDWQRTLSRGADRWRRLAGPEGQVRILQGVYAGALAVRTGRCPLCPPTPAADMPR